MNEGTGAFIRPIQSVQFMPQKSSGTARKVYSSHGCHVRESRLEDDAGTGEPSAEMHRGCPTERSAEYDEFKVSRRRMLTGHRVSSFGIQIKSGFGNSAAALSVAAIIEDEYIQPDIVQTSKVIDPMGDISCIPMADNVPELPAETISHATA
jgi:hypothetical protein